MSDTLAMPAGRVRDADTAAQALRAGVQWPTMAADLRRMVPRWHFDMLNDHDRNRALIGALEAAVRPGDLVLDIGTGAGLTALAAARAGADVVTCEVNPVVAELARQVIQANGYTDRIVVQDMPSTRLEVGRHLPRPADLLVAEVFDADLFSEGAAPTIDDARRRLLRPGAAMLPSRAEVWCQLVESEQLYGLNHVGAVEGFDLSAFNQVATRGALYASTACHDDTRPLSDPTLLFEVDFAAPLEPDHVTVPVADLRSGILHAAVVWFRLELRGLDWQFGLSNPPGEPSHWKQTVFLLDGLPVRAGDRLLLDCSHDLRHLTLESHRV